MLTTSAQSLLFLTTAIFITAVFLNIVKKNSLAVVLYLIQSVATAMLLLLLNNSFSLLFVFALIATVAVKVFIAPYFFLSLIRKHRLTFSVSNYLNLPITLLILAALTTLANSHFFDAFSSFMPQNREMLMLSVTAILISIFLSINRRGALSQMLSILSLENSIVAFALLSGLEQSSGLELGITFDILIWIIIATVFGTMMFRQFGSLDVTVMKHLTEEP